MIPSGYDCYIAMVFRNGPKIEIDDIDGLPFAI